MEMEQTTERRPRYAPGAYDFVRRSLDRAQELAGERRHVTGPELLAGLRDLALEEYGLLARPVLASWGIRSSEDVGAIVFEMIDAGLLSKTEQDSVADFGGALDFGASFDEGYLW
jgi:uncharacterized repeat protein (TIGR04138 family)